MTLEWIKNNQKQARNLHRIWIFSHCLSKNVKFSLYFSNLSFFHFSTFSMIFVFFFFCLCFSYKRQNQIWICNSQFFCDKTNTESVQTERTGTTVKCNRKMLSNSSDGCDSSVLILPLSFDLFFWLFLALACTLFVLFFFLFL